MKEYISDKVKEEMDYMAKSIMSTHDRIDKVNIYGHNDIIKAIESGEMEFPKSSIIQPEIEGSRDEIPAFMINDIDEMHCDKYPAI